MGTVVSQQDENLRLPDLLCGCIVLLGEEFEQGCPVIEAIRNRYSGVKIVLTFFSPSGYEIRKNYPGADHVMYLPLDSSKNANEFLRLVKPNLAIFVKYEFWHFYLKALHEKQIPVVLISGIFRPSQPFFHWWGISP
ncbi:MAG: glycosyltransferase N-terminal domain-containing protein [Chitinophagaceae bacterium]